MTATTKSAQTHHYLSNTTCLGTVRQWQYEEQRNKYEHVAPVACTETTSSAKSYANVIAVDVSILRL